MERKFYFKIRRKLHSLFNYFYKTFFLYDDILWKRKEGDREIEREEKRINDRVGVQVPYGSLNNT